MVVLVTTNILPLSVGNQPISQEEEGEKKKKKEEGKGVERGRRRRGSTLLSRR